MMEAFVLGAVRARRLSRVAVRRQSRSGEYGPDRAIQRSEHDDSAIDPTPNGQHMAKLLVIDDDRAVLRIVQKGLGRADETDSLAVVTANTAEDGLKAVDDECPDVVLLDIMLPDSSGMDVFLRIRDRDPRLPVIFITADAGSASAIEAMQLGAYDYIAKPLDIASLRGLVEQALETRRLMNVPVALPTSEPSDAPGDAFIGRSPQMLDVFKTIGRVARQKVPVLIHGESGTGKELVARAIYQHSDRADKPFLAVNCAAIPDALLESELFGHEKGAFTGADRRRIGKFEQCNGGTIFLDEIGDMSPAVQGKMLRLLQEQRFERVGGNDAVETDVRVVAATNRDLEQMVEDGDFRADLLFRLKGVLLALPPLRDRDDDVPLLVQHYLSIAAREMGKPQIEGVSPDALEIMLGYKWPGNVRELQSAVRQAVLRASGPVIVPEFLPDELTHGKNPTAPAENRTAVETTSEGGSRLPETDLVAFVDRRLRAGTTSLYAEAVEMLEKYVLMRVLRETGGNQSKAAEILGITRGKIRDRIAAFNIVLDRNVAVDD